MLENFRSLKSTIDELNYILDRKQKLKAMAVFFSMLLTSLLELLGVSVIYPFLQVILTPEKIKEKTYISWIYKLTPDLSDRGLLLILGGIIIVVFLLKNAVALGCAYLQNKFAVEFQRDEATEMLDSYMKRPYQFFINTNSAELLRGINGDTNNAYMVLLGLFQMFGEMITVCLIGLFLISTDWFIALGTLSIVTLCAAGIVLALKNKMKQAGKLNRIAVKDRNQYSYQSITGIKEITVLDRRELFVAQYRNAAQKTAEASLISSFFSAIPDRLLEAVCIGGVMGIICVRILLGIELDTFIPVIGTFAMGAFKILPSVSKISSRINSIVFNLPGLQSCYDNIRMARNLELDQNNKGSENEVKNELQTTNVQFKEKLEIKNISWKYQNAKEDILHDLSLTIHKGQSVAFVGASGAGKTTLADVIMGLLKPATGTVEVDGHNISSIPHQWSKMIGYVPQSVFLIDDTIRANVAFGIPKEVVSDEKMWEALSQAQLKTFVESLPEGLNTIVGERGVKLSGGQRQRIAIARALYENPDILVLDEATSALDTETENAVMESIEALQGHKTLIIVAHRLTTIRNCDVIYEIGNGKAIERCAEEVFER